VLEGLLFGAPEQRPSPAELSDQLDEIFRGQRPAEEATRQREVVPAAGSAGTRALLALVAEGFASRLSFGLVGFALPLYARGLGLSLAAIGVLASLNTIVALVLKPVMGAAADRYGRKRTLGSRWPSAASSPSCTRWPPPPGGCTPSGLGTAWPTPCATPRSRR